MANHAHRQRLELLSVQSVSREAIDLIATLGPLKRSSPHEISPRLVPILKMAALNTRTVSPRMDRWLFGSLAHGAAVGGLRRIGRYAAGHRSLCRAASCLGGRDVGRLYAPVHWPLCPHLRPD